MQKFTRNLTREIELGGERVSVTLDADGVTLRPVGSRKPPHTVTWAGVLCAATTPAGPAADQITAAIAALKKGGEKPPTVGATSTEAPPHAEPPIHTDHHHAEAPAHATHHAEASAHTGHHAEAPAHTGHHAEAPAHTGHHAEAPAHTGHHAEAPAPVAPSAEHVRPAPVLSGLTAVLARIDHWLAKNRPGFHSGLLPGASDADCDNLSSSLGVPLPSELRTLLKWHNGQSPDVTGAFERSFFLLNSDQIAEDKKDFDAAPRNGWKPGLIPFLDDEQDNLVCLDTTAAGVPVVECWTGHAHATVTQPSLAAWLERFATALERAEYAEDPERGSFSRKS